MNPDATALTRAELNLGAHATVIAPAEKMVGHKPEAVGLGESMTVANWTWSAAKAWASDFDYDTKAISDGAYDLIVRTENGHGWWDSFDPDFAGDATANRNSDERWLKHLQTWFNQDSDPDNDYEGKVIVDNEAPQIDNSSRKPASN